MQSKSGRCNSCHGRRATLRYQTMREQVLQGYGASCKCCGEENEAFLTLDHVNRDGANERRNGGNDLAYKKAIELNFPEEYQILCYNCNLGRERYDGTCPHKLAVVVAVSDLSKDTRVVH